MKNIEKIAKLYKFVQEIDSEIISLEKIATQIINEKQIIKFTFHIESLEPKEDKMPEEPDPLSFLSLSAMYGNLLQTKLADIKDHKFKLDSKTALLALSVICESLKLKRDEFMGQIDALMKDFSK